MSRSASIAIVCLALCSGCTTLSLERHTVRQAGSAMDVRYQEIVDNLAMVADNPWAIPAYSSIFSGTTDITDSIQVSSQSTWSRALLKPSGSTTTFGTETLDIPASRAIKQNWTLDPTVAPEKLRAMRSACWWAIFGPNGAGEDAIWLERYSPGFPAGCYFNVADRLSRLKPGWLHVGHQRSAPSRASYSASCHDTTVWVMPEGMKCLSEFVLVMQSIARMEMSESWRPSPRTRTVEWSNEKEGSAIPQDGELGGTINGVTMYLDDDNNPTPGENVPAIAKKKRFDNTGKYADLKSVINASAKGP